MSSNELQRIGPYILEAKLARGGFGNIWRARHEETGAQVAVKVLHDKVHVERGRVRLVRKVYWALVEGEPSQEEGTWEDYIREVPDEARAEISDADTAGAKRAARDASRCRNPRGVRCRLVPGTPIAESRTARLVARPTPRAPPRASLPDWHETIAIRIPMPSTGRPSDT